MMMMMMIDVCRGLVEIVVLNVGLEAKVINPEIFTIMVLMALITTFMTTPIVHWAYPPERRTMMAGQSYDAVPTHTAKKASILDQALLVSRHHHRHHHHHHDHAHRPLGLPSGAAHADGGPQL
jgi:Kef-type K+ transport system membrane component KefB